MKVDVRLLVTREQILRGTTLCLELASPASVGDVLRRLADQDRSLVELALVREPTLTLRPGLALLLNGANVLLAPQALETPVSEGDRLSLIHGISGG
jgi:sulfur carrier protein ThiS